MDIVLGSFVSSLRTSVRSLPLSWYAANRALDQNAGRQLQRVRKLAQTFADHYQDHSKAWQGIQLETRDTMVYPHVSQTLDLCD